MNKKKQKNLNVLAYNFLAYVHKKSSTKDIDAILFLSYDVTVIQWRYGYTINSYKTLLQEPNNVMMSSVSTMAFFIPLMSFEGNKIPFN